MGVILSFLKIGLDLLGIVVAIYIAYFILDCLLWKIARRKNCPRISFKLFKEMYQLNPDIWSLDNLNYLIFNKSIYSHQRIEFDSYKDVLKYNYFRKKQRKNKYEQERHEAEVDLLRELQKEIDKYQKENIEEIKIHLEKNE